MQELPLGNLSVLNCPGDCIRWRRRNSLISWAFNAEAELCRVLRDGHGCGRGHAFAAVVYPRIFGPGCLFEMDGYGMLRRAAGPGIDSLPQTALEGTVAKDWSCTSLNSNSRCRAGLACYLAVTVQVGSRLGWFIPVGSKGAYCISSQWCTPDAILYQWLPGHDSGVPGLPSAVSSLDI